MSNTPENPAPRILIVDDDWMNRELLSTILTADNFLVLEAARGEKALSMAQTHIPDLILLDVRMPDMNGYAVCRQLKSNAATAPIPVIMITGLEEDSERQRALDAGAVNIVNRFLSMSELTAMIRAYLAPRN